MYLKNGSDYLFGNNRPSMWKLYGDNINEEMRFNFKITQTNNDNFAIQSLFDGMYLDGRDNGQTDTLLTNRDPTDDPYLQWKLIPIHLIDYDV